MIGGICDFPRFGTPKKHWESYDSYYPGLGSVAGVMIYLEVGVWKMSTVGRARESMQIALLNIHNYCRATSFMTTHQVFLYSYVYAP